MVDLAVTRSALGASCRSEGRWARSRVRGKRVDGRVCSVTVAAVRLKEVWLCDPEGIRRPEPHPGAHLHAVKGKTVMYWSLNKISVYGDRVHGEAVNTCVAFVDPSNSTLGIHKCARGTSPPCFSLLSLLSLRHLGHLAAHLITSPESVGRTRQPSHVRSPEVTAQVGEGYTPLRGGSHCPR